MTREHSSTDPRDHPAGSGSAQPECLTNEGRGTCPPPEADTGFTASQGTPTRPPLATRSQLHMGKHRPRVPSLTVALLWSLSMLTVADASLMREGARSDLTQRAIMDKLLADYDSSMRPGLWLQQQHGSCDAGGRTDRATVWLEAGQLTSVNQIEKTFHLDGLLVYEWRDERLAYAHLSCLPRLTFSGMESAGDLWKPDMTIQETRSVRAGGAPGSMAYTGESVAIYPGGNVSWSRHVQYVIACQSMNYGRLPFDEQTCTLTFVSFRYSILEMNVSFSKNQSTLLTSSWSSGEWQIDLIGTKSSATAAPLLKAQAIFCVSLKRSSSNYAIVVAVAILLTTASWAGFFIDKNAVPGRIALAFLTFLMVLNNLNSTLQRLPPLQRATSNANFVHSASFQVWLVDFLIGTMCFNFISLLEFAAVNFGAVRSRAKVNALAVQDANARGVELQVSNAAQSGRSTRLSLVPVCQPTWAESLANLDSVFRWLYPLSYLIFLVIMFSTIDRFASHTPEECIGL